MNFMGYNPFCIIVAMKTLSSDSNDAYLYQFSKYMYNLFWNVCQVFYVMPENNV